METQSLSNLQLELLRTYSRQIDDADLVAIRTMLANYFAEKAIRLADDVWEENNWESADTEKLSREHHRKSSTL